MPGLRFGGIVLLASDLRATMLLGGALPGAQGGDDGCGGGGAGFGAGRSSVFGHSTDLFSVSDTVSPIPKMQRTVYHPK